MRTFIKKFGYLFSLATLLLLTGIGIYWGRSAALSGGHWSNAASSPATAAPVATAAPTAAPLLRPLAGSVLIPYSDTPVHWAETGEYRTHEAVDFAAMPGTSVYAAAAGTVTGMYRDALFGNTIEITHADGCISVYASLTAEACVRIGDSVRAGDPIGTAGDTAAVESALGTHLHFEMRRKGENIRCGFDS